jgi:predicted nucleic acid-binding Zn finger protein
MNSYMLKQNGYLMPCDTDGTLTESGLVEVTSPNGTLYTTASCNLVNLDDAAYMLRLARGEKLVQAGYQVMHLRGDRYRVWNQKRHGDTGGYCVTMGETPTCSCPDFAKRGEACKHIHGIDELLRCALVTKPTVRVTAATNAAAAPPLAPATRVQPSARLAAMIQRDGWE